MQQIAAPHNQQPSSVVRLCFRNISLAYSSGQGLTTRLQVDTAWPCSSAITAFAGQRFACRLSGYVTIINTGDIDITSSLRCLQQQQLVVFQVGSNPMHTLQRLYNHCHQHVWLPAVPLLQSCLCAPAACGRSVCGEWVACHIMWQLGLDSA